MILVHGTSVELGGMAVLLRGPSGSGKSDLALRLIDAGARLVADDLVALAAEGGRLVAALPETAPANLVGCLEVRGLGILKVASVAAAPLALVVDLVVSDAVARLPEPERVELGGILLPCLKLAPFEAAAAAKVRLALAVWAPAPVPESTPA